VYVIKALAKVSAFAARFLIPDRILPMNSMSKIDNSSVHQFGGVLLGKFASLQA
jgi:hypothetical protein